MTDPGTGESAAIKLADGLGWKDRGAIDATVLRPSVRQRIGWTARCTKPYHVEGGL